MIELRFLGAAGTVTGSKYLLRASGRSLMVDCGLFQGLKALRLRNWAPPPVAPKDVDAVVLTHAHLDHSGYLPRFIRQGFAGPVHSSPGTRDLCAILLPDSGYLQQEEARYANKRSFSKHKPALPLYTEEEARASLKRFAPVPFRKETSVAGDRSCARSAPPPTGGSRKSAAKPTPRRHACMERPTAAIPSSTLSRERWRHTRRGRTRIRW